MTDTILPFPCNGNDDGAIPVDAARVLLILFERMREAQARNPDFAFMAAFVVSGMIESSDFLVSNQHMEETNEQ